MAIVYCPICDKEMTHLTNQTKTIKLKQPDGLVELTLEGISFYQCCSCNEILYSLTDIEIYDSFLNQYHNKRRKEKKLLTGEEIKEIRLNTGLTRTKIEKLLGYNEKSFLRWEKNRVDQSKSVDWLLRIIRKHGLEILKDL